MPICIKILPSHTGSACLALGWILMRPRCSSAGIETAKPANRCSAARPRGELVAIGGRCRAKRPTEMQPQRRGGLQAHGLRDLIDGRGARFEALLGSQEALVRHPLMWSGSRLVPEP